MEDSKLADSDMAANLLLAVAGVGMDILWSSASVALTEFPLDVSTFPSCVERGGDKLLVSLLADSAG